MEKICGVVARGLLEHNLNAFLVAIMAISLVGCNATGAKSIGSGDCEISFAGTTFPGRHVVYILQASGAAIDDWACATQLVDESVEQLSPAQQFEIIWNKPGGEPVGLFGELRRATRETVGRVPGALSGVTPRGHVELYPSFRKALALKPDVVVLYASGGEVEVDLVEKVCRLNTLGIPIYVFSYWTDLKEEDWLKVLSNRTGGRQIYR